jgi:hypothetical protein
VGEVERVPESTSDEVENEVGRISRELETSGGKCRESRESRKRVKKTRTRRREGEVSGTTLLESGSPVITGSWSFVRATQCRGETGGDSGEIESRMTSRRWKGMG